MTTENLIKLKGLRTTYDKRSLSLQRYQTEIQALIPQTDKYAVARKAMLTGAVASLQSDKPPDTQHCGRRLCRNIKPNKLFCSNYSRRDNRKTRRHKIRF